MNVRETSLSHPPTFSSTHSPVQLPVVAYVSVLFWLPAATYALQVLPRKPTIFLSSFEPLVLNCTQVEIQRLVGSPKSCLDFEDFIRQRVHEVPSLHILLLLLKEEFEPISISRVLFTARASPSIPDLMDRTPIYLAAERGHTGCVDFLADKFKVKH